VSLYPITTCPAQLYEKPTEFSTLFRPYFTDHDSPRTAKLLQDYDEFEFPNCHFRFGDLAIYVRKG
jgi:hypothetical protein